MALLVDEPDPSDPRRLALEATRTADRLRTLSLVRLGAPLGDGLTRAGAAVALAQDLADRAADLAGRPRRALPALPDQAAGDVLAVCARDLLEALETAGPRAAAECSRAVEQLRGLRRDL